MLPAAALPLPQPTPRATVRVRRLWQSIHSWGLRQAAAYVFQLDDLTLPGSSHDDSLPDGYVFRDVCWEDLVDCVATSGTTLDEYRRRWQHGGRCYAVFRNGQAAHSGWLHFGSIYVRGLGFLIEADLSTCYVYNIVTAAEHRQRGLYRNSQRKLTAMLRTHGVRRMTQVVMATNVIPQIVLPQLGYRLVHSVRHSSLFGWKMTTVRNPAGRVISRRLFCRTPKTVFVI